MTTPTPEPTPTTPPVSGRPTPAGSPYEVLARRILTVLLPLLALPLLAVMVRVWRMEGPFASTATSVVLSLLLVLVTIAPAALWLLVVGQSWGPAIRGTIRYGSLVLILWTAAATAGYVIQTEDPRFVNALKVVSMTMGGMVLLVALLTWLLTVTNFGWRIRVGGAVASLLILAGWRVTVAEIDNNGDMVPYVRYRWEPSADDLLAEHREQQQRQAASDTTEVVAWSVEPGPLDSPEYRGPQRSGHVSVPNFDTDWEETPPRVLWGPYPVGGGYAAFAVAGDLAITIEQRGELEAVVAYKATTGSEAWEHQYEARFEEAMGGPGPRATPTIADGVVYSLGAAGDLLALDGSTGKPLWHVNILEENETGNIEWGMAGSPLVYGDLVVVNPGVNGGKGNDAAGGLVAYRRDDGSRAWAANRHQAGYASPQRAVLDGVEQILLFDAHGLAGYDPAEGTELWRYPWAESPNSEKPFATLHGGINVAQPIPLDDHHVLIATGYNIGSMVVEVGREGDAWSVAPAWEGGPNRRLRTKFHTPVVVGDYVYGFDDTIMACLRLSDGRRMWKGGRYGHGQVLAVNDAYLLVLSERGELCLVEATPDEHRELARIEALDGPKTWNNPTVADGIAYLRNHKQMVAIDLREPTAAPSEGAESTGEPDPAPMPPAGE